MDAITVSFGPGGIGGAVSAPPVADRQKVHFLFAFVFPTKKTSKKLVCIS
jgi:hypothetical protein